jgi:disulfide bond formation protein DsbB
VQAFTSLVLIIIAVAYFENSLKLEPCYLCMTQRAFVIAIGIICALAVLHNPRQFGQRIYAALSISLVIIGSYFSGKQLWLQSLPEDQVPSCGIPVDYLFDIFSITEAISLLLRGDGNCAEVKWQLMGLSMPAWVMVSFVGFGVLGTVQFLRKA